MSTIRTVGEVSYDSSQLIGKGTNTFVFKGTFERRKVAIKKIFCESDEDIEKRLNEVKILWECDSHDNIVKYHRKERDSDFIYIALELCDGNLQQWMDSKIPNVNHDAISAIEILHQTTNGLAHLHSKGIIHRDLNPNNILLTRLNQREIRVKIADFGISRLLPEGRTSLSIITGSETVGWRSPEILNYSSNASDHVDRMSTATDIFSLGCLYYYVLTAGKHPFGDDSIAWEHNIKNYNISIDRQHFSVLLVGNFWLIQAMIARDPKARPSAENVSHFADQLLKSFTASIQPRSPQVKAQNLLNPSIQTASLQNEDQNLSNTSIQFPNLQNETQNLLNSPIQSSSTQNEGRNSRSIRNIRQIRYDTSKLLGKGTNTYVYKGKFQDLEVAVKKITYGDEKEFKKQTMEAEILRQCSRHPNVITFHKFEKDANFTYIAVELCHGTLGHWLDGKIYTIPKSAISSINLLHQATNGLAHLCKMKVVHRDLKPENILLRAVNGGVVVKIADFGISRTLPQNRSRLTVKTGTGTLGWRAPEIIRTENTTIVCTMSTATDIFSLGCIFYYVLSDKKHPFGDDKYARENNINNYQKKIDERNIPNFLVENLKLIEAMIAEEPSERPSIDQILCHPIFGSN